MQPYPLQPSTESLFVYLQGAILSPLGLASCEQDLASHPSANLLMLGPLLSRPVTSICFGHVHASFLFLFQSEPAFVAAWPHRARASS